MTKTHVGRMEGLWGEREGGNKGEGKDGKGKYRKGGVLRKGREGHTIFVPKYEDKDGLQAE